MHHSFRDSDGPHDPCSDQTADAGIASLSSLGRSLLYSTGRLEIVRSGDATENHLRQFSLPPLPPGVDLALVNEGGPLVIILFMVALMLVAFVIERFLSLAKAKGSSSIQVFFKKFIILVKSGDWDAALAACDKQRGSTANVLRAGIEEFRNAENDPNMDNDKKIQAVQAGIEEANALEGPLLERNLMRRFLKRL